MCGMTNTSSCLHGGTENEVNKSWHLRDFFSQETRQVTVNNRSLVASLIVHVEKSSFSFEPAGCCLFQHFLPRSSLRRNENNFIWSFVNIFFIHFSLERASSCPFIVHFFRSKVLPANCLFNFKWLNAARSSRGLQMKTVDSPWMEMQHKYMKR